MSVETDLELSTMLHTIPLPPQEAPKEKEQLPLLPLVDIGPEEPVVVTREPTPDLSVLHDLQPINRLFITKKLRVRNVVLLRGRRNRYLIKTPDHTLVYTIEEHNNSWAGYLCLGLRPLHLSVMNGQGTEVMRIQRPFACTGRCLPCQLQHMDVYSPPGELLGTVEQQWTAVKPVYLVKNDNGDDVFWVQGPFMTVSCYTDVQFDISRPDGTPVGATCKRWQGLTHAIFFQPVTDSFGVAFEMDLTVEEKGLLLAATLLMDYMYYDA